MYEVITTNNGRHTGIDHVVTLTDEQFNSPAWAEQMALLESGEYIERLVSFRYIHESGVCPVCHRKLKEVAQ